MKTKYLDEKINELEILKRLDELTDIGYEMLIEFNKIKQALTIPDVMKSLPEETDIRNNAREMDEKEFEHWWWETVYKAKFD